MTQTADCKKGIHDWSGNFRVAHGVVEGNGYCLFCGIPIRIAAKGEPLAPCDGVAPRDKLPCARALGHVKDHSHIGPFRNTPRGKG